MGDVLVHGWKGELLCAQAVCPSLVCLFGAVRKMPETDGVEPGDGEAHLLAKSLTLQAELSVLARRGSLCYLVVLGMVWVYFCSLTAIWGSP